MIIVALRYLVFINALFLVFNSQAFELEVDHDGAADEFKEVDVGGIYYSAAHAPTHLEQHGEVHLERVSKNTIRLQVVNFRGCLSDVYHYEKNLSLAMGAPAYKTKNKKRYLIQADAGVFWAATAQLGDQLWKKRDSFYVLGPSKVAMRQLSEDKLAWRRIERTLKVYAVRAKVAEEERYAKTMFESNTGSGF